MTQAAEYLLVRIKSLFNDAHASGPALLNRLQLTSDPSLKCTSVSQKAAQPSKHDCHPVHPTSSIPVHLLNGQSERILEPPLIGVREASISPSMFPGPGVSLPRVTRFSSRSARGRRMMGSGEQGVSICFTTWSADADRFGTLNEIASPIVPTGTIRVTLAGEVWPGVVPFDGAGVSRSCEGSDGGRRLLAKAELSPVAPHPVQDDGELARDRHAGPRHATMLGNLHVPGTQARLFAATRQRSVNCRYGRISIRLSRTGTDGGLRLGGVSLAEPRTLSNWGSR
jgi:hypothetical protein